MYSIKGFINELGGRLVEKIDGQIVMYLPCNVRLIDAKELDRRLISTTKLRLSRVYRHHNEIVIETQISSHNDSQVRNSSLGTFFRA